MKNIEKIKITNDSTIKQALKIISDGAIQIAIVVDKKGKLLGTLTDGDIRRGFLKGLNINSSIKSIIFKKPIIAKKNDTKEKLIKIALSKKIYQIPVVDNNFKVIGIRVLNELIKAKNKSNKVVIMAGGRGVRLRPLTKNIPKPMLKVGNKPILQILLEKFRESGYENFIICVNYKSKIIMDYFGDGLKFGVKIEYIQEKKRMGTAGALSLLKKKPKEPFFVVNGDLLTNLDFEKMLNFHHEHNSKATMCISEYNIESPYGEVKLEQENIILIDEKPIHKFFVNAGIYIFSQSILKNLKKEIKKDAPEFFLELKKKNKKIIIFPAHEEWKEIGTLENFEKFLKKNEKSNNYSS